MLQGAKRRAVVICKPPIPKRRAPPVRGHPPSIGHLMEYYCHNIARSAHEIFFIALLERRRNGPTSAVGSSLASALSLASRAAVRRRNFNGARTPPRHRADAADPARGSTTLARSSSQARPESERRSPAEALCPGFP